MEKAFRKISAMILCALVFGPLARGQTITPDVLGTAGTQGIVGTTTVEWTVGETAIETISGSGNTITQGFHQPKYTVVALDEPLIAEIGIRVYPNPASDQVYMDISRGEESTLKVQLIDLTGRILDARSTLLMQDKLTFDLSQVAVGQYFLRVIREDGSMFKAYKVDKVY
jgi:hypothetical protein